MRGHKAQSILFAGPPPPFAQQRRTNVHAKHNSNSALCCRSVLVQQPRLLFGQHTCSSPAQPARRGKQHPTGTVASQHSQSNRQQLSANMPQAAFQQWHEKQAGSSSFKAASPGARMLIRTLVLSCVLRACNHLDTWLGLSYGEQTNAGATGP